MTDKETFEEQDKEFEKWRNSGEIVQSIQHLMIRDSWYKADMKYSYRTGAERFEVIARKRTLEEIGGMIQTQTHADFLIMLENIEDYIDTELEKLNDPLPPN